MYSTPGELAMKQETEKLSASSHSGINLLLFFLRDNILLYIVTTFFHVFFQSFFFQPFLSLIKVTDSY